MGYMDKELNDLEKGTISTTEEIASIVYHQKHMPLFCVKILLFFVKKILHPDI